MSEKINKVTNMKTEIEQERYILSDLKFDL